MSAHSLVVQIGADISSLTSGLRAASSHVTQFARQNQQALQSIGAMGAAVTGLGVIAVAGFGAAVKTAADFESSMSRVGALSGASSAELEKLTAAAKEAGETTAWSASQSAEALQYLALAGWDTNEMIAGLPGMLNLASAGALDLATAADITSDMMSMFGIEADKAGHVADVFAKASTSANTDVQQLGEALKYLGANASALGWDIHESSAAIMALADSGVKGSMAGQAFATSLGRLAQPTAKMQKLMEKLNIDFFDTEGNMKSLPEVVGVLEDSLAGMTAQQRSAALTTLFGAEAFKHWQILINRGSDDLEKMTASLEKSGGTAEEVANKQLENLNGQLTILKSGLEAAAISIGEALLPALKFITSGVQQVVDIFNSFSDKTKSIVAIVGVLSAAFTLFGGGLLLAIGFLPSLIMGFQALLPIISPIAAAFTALATGPMALIVAAIAGIIAAIVLAYNKVDWFKESVNEAWEGIKIAFSTALEFIKEIVQIVMSEVSGFIGEKLAEIKAFWEENGDAIMKRAELTFKTIELIITTVMGVIKTLFQTVWPIISGIVQIAWALIQSVIGTSITAVLGIINGTMKLMQGDWEGAWEKIKETGKTIWKNIEGYFEDIDLVQIGKDIISGLISGIGSMAKDVGTKVKEIASMIPDGIKSFLNIKSPSRVLMRLGEYTGEGLAIGIDSMVRDVKKSAKELAVAAVPSIQMSHNTPNVSGVGIVASFDGRSSHSTGTMDRAVGMMEQALQMMNGMQVVMDGEKVGTLVAPTVNREISRENADLVRRKGQRR
ncbi:phage tail tape measure protein [Cytobacillus sp. FSL K6-0129]|uniref:phage tail tape measure protein n=1 Tax=Cytobacillus sp. FSL K6-0129 TaxID=2921421 RepID=UPI0030FC0B82